MPSRRLRARSNFKAPRKTIFGPAPILRDEDSAAYELFLEELYADRKPTDIIQHVYLEDFAYWTWELQRLRRMRICIIEAMMPTALTWVLAVPHNFRLSYIGETHTIDIKKVINPPIPEADLEEMRASCAEAEELLSAEGIKFNHGSRLAADFPLMKDTAMTRAFLEQIDLVERIDRMIITTESRRNAVYRELERHRASVASRWREKIRNFEEAKFKVIKPVKLRGYGRKKVA